MGDSGGFLAETLAPSGEAGPQTFRLRGEKKRGLNTIDYTGQSAGLAKLDMKQRAEEYQGFTKRLKERARTKFFETHDELGRPKETLGE